MKPRDGLAQLLVLVGEGGCEGSVIEAIGNLMVCELPSMESAGS